MNQGVKEIELEEQKVNKKMENMRDGLKKKEESNNQLLTELTAQKEVERLLKLDHQRNQETHHEEVTVKLIKSVTDKVARSNQ